MFEEIGQAWKENIQNNRKTAGCYMPLVSFGIFRTVPTT